MQKRLALALTALMVMAAAQAQQPLASRANVTAYYDDAAVEKLAYRESPYFQELAGSWQQKQTDSSIRYTQYLDVEREWRDFRVFLNVRCGKAVRVLLNDKELGCWDDSRHWNEFLLDPALKYGKSNTLTIEAMKHAKGAMLEDPAMPVGMNGTPFLLFKNDPNVADFSLVADYEATTESGTLTVLADVFCGKRKGKYYLEVEVWDPKGHVFDRMGRWVVFNGRSEEMVEISRSWSGVTPWNAESPVLYTALIRLRDEQMAEEETVGAKFGFRRIQVKDGQLQLNGKAVTIKGVTYGVERSDGPAARERMKNDVFSMKRMNVNAVRTSKYSPVDPYFYELCDQYGLYVVCDANLLPLSDRNQAVATDKDYLPLFERRVENMYGKYKNHTSIVAWSLGSTRDNGVCMTGAFKRLKALDNTRPVLFSGADHGESTDIIAPSYPDLKTFKQTFAKQSSRPYLMLAAVDREHFADIQPLWQMVKNHRQLQGGFVDAWPLDMKMQSELKHLYSPFGVNVSKLTADEGEFVVTNYSDYASFGQYSLEYSIYTPTQPNITGGELAVAIPAGGMDKVGMLIPAVNLKAGEDLFIKFELKSRSTARRPWQRNEDMVRGVVQLPLMHSRRTSGLYNKEKHAVADSIDDQTMIPHELFFVGHEDWKVVRESRQVRRIDESTLCVDRLCRYMTADNRTMCKVRSTYTLFGTGDVVVDYEVAPTGRIRGGKFIPAVKIPHKGDSLTWYGHDREVYFDTNHSAQTGVYRHAADDLRRRDVRWCARFAGGSPALFMEFLGTMCTMEADKAGVVMIPQNTKEIRLHMRPYSQGEAADYYGYDYPRTRLDAPIPVDTVQNSSAGHIVSTTFSRKPNTPYNLGADTILFDGETGNPDDLSVRWLGFSGADLQVQVELSEATAVDYLTIRCAHNPAVWAFAPVHANVCTSLDGITFSQPYTVEATFDPADQENAASQVAVMEIPINEPSAKYIRVNLATLPQLPAWHRGKGLKPWLLMDELEVVSKE